MIFTQWSIFLDVHWKLVDQFFLLGKDYSIWRNIDNGNTCLESYYLHHQRLGHISWNWIKRLIDSGILNFSGRTMVHVKHIWFFTPSLLRRKVMKGLHNVSYIYIYLHCIQFFQHVKYLLKNVSNISIKNVSNIFVAFRNKEAPSKA